MKLEFKHIAGYLPYGLEFILSKEGIFNLDSKFWVPHEATHPMKIVNLLISDHVEVGLYSKKTDWGVGLLELYEIMPILRPLSDLTKEIEINGEKFIPAIKLGFMKCDIDFILNNKIDLIQFRFIKKLHEWHFDIYGLIENGLAIDINTLKT